MFTQKISFVDKSFTVFELYEFRIFLVFDLFDFEGAPAFDPLT